MPQTDYTSRENQQRLIESLVRVQKAFIEITDITEADYILLTTYVTYSTEYKHVLLYVQAWKCLFLRYTTGQIRRLPGPLR